jgi:D-alanyl-D-alanine carboxypeptidase/D-alanyl-D-alanine-endopeptidase (penicillin-binding protein 4)
MKIATSFVALAKLGPDYRYRTNFRAGGSIDWNTHTLNGDLIVQGGSNPVFASSDADEVALQLSKLGITHATGGLRIAGPFYYFARGYHSNLSPETSAGKLRTALQRSGIKIEGATNFGASEGPLLLSHYSDPLESILLFQNAHSSNAIAEVVGASIGGPRAIQDYLIQTVGLSETDIFVGRASGLDFNRITPRATLRVLRALIQLLADHSLRPDDVMPVAGVDSGTLHGRLAREDVRGGVVAKTGTLVSLDNGVSTLVGIAYTKTKGPLLFAVFDSGGNVNAYRHIQDQFIEQIIAESGGAVAVSRSEDALADVVRHSIVQVLWKPSDQSAETSTE